MNRINRQLKATEKLLSIYFTAGYPGLEDTIPVLEQLQDANVDMVEIGLPFSDPLADGPVIQHSSHRALQNGMTTERLFEQLSDVRKTIRIPLVIMGYLNPVIQYGVENFCKKCAQTGIDGLIIPDMPVGVYQEEYRGIFEKYGLINIFLITPQTSEDRIRFIDSISKGFIYMVSSASTTGVKAGFGKQQRAYFKRIRSLNLKSPQIIGFGISNHNTMAQALKYSKGAIVGSAFIDFLDKNPIRNIPQFITSLTEK